MSGLIGCISFQNEDVIPTLIKGIYGLQHRGQDGIGIGLWSDETEVILHHSSTIDTMNPVDTQASVACAMTRYAFTNQKKKEPMMPIRVDNSLVIEDGKSRIDGDYAQAQIKISPSRMICSRDLMGIKPLVLGRIKKTWIVASESCAIESLGGSVLRDIMPGETIVIDENGLKSLQSSKHHQPHLCLFEMVYIARPDSTIDGQLVYQCRQQMGHELAKEHPVNADIVVGSPDSGMIAALGYSEETQIPYQKALVKNRYVNRTFINANPTERNSHVQIKISVVSRLVKGKSVVLVDDSIVRGTTIKHIVKLLKEAGASEVHIRVSSPPVLFADNLSIDIPNPKNLMCHGKTEEDLIHELGCDSIKFLSLEKLISSCHQPHFYTEYFDGKSIAEDGGYYGKDI